MFLKILSKAWIAALSLFLSTITLAMDPITPDDLSIVSFRHSPEHVRAKAALASRGLWLEHEISFEELKNRGQIFRNSSLGKDFLTAMEIINNDDKVSNFRLKTQDCCDYYLSRNKILLQLIAKKAFCPTVPSNFQQKSVGTFCISGSTLGHNHLTLIRKETEGVYYYDYKIATKYTMTLVTNTDRKVPLVIDCSYLQPNLDDNDNSYIIRSIDMISYIEKSSVLFIELLHTLYEPLSAYAPLNTEAFRVVYGENHGVPMTRQVLINDLDFLVKLEGVQTLGLEFLQSSQQKLLDDYITINDNSEAEGILAIIESQLRRVIPTSHLERPNVLDVIRKARTAGIKRIIALDHEHLLPLAPYEGRIIYQNAFALIQLVKLANLADGLVILEGNDHVAGLAMSLGAKAKDLALIENEQGLPSTAFERNCLKARGFAGVSPSKRHL